MADVFISYAEEDRDKVVPLAAYLESEGWTVWWDKNLSAGELYRDEIMRELVAARVVIVLWTRNSIKSGFVRGEAGRAMAAGKLIPVKTDDVEYGDIPLPFGEMHTERLSNKELIRAAVVAQLAKPMVQPSALWIATKTLRYQVLTWLGIVGGALTVFSGLRGILDLAAWAKWIVSRWEAWAHLTWQWLFTFLQIDVPPYWAPLLTFSSFAVMIAVGQRVIYATTQKTRPATAVPDISAISFTQMAVVMLGVPLILFLYVVATLFVTEPAGVGEIVTVGTAVLPLAYLVCASKRKLKSAVSLAVIMVFYVIITVLPTISIALDMLSFGELLVGLDDKPKLVRLVFGKLSGSSLLAIYFSHVFFSALMLAIAPINALTKRLAFLAFGVMILIGLNELSKHSDAIRNLLKLSS